MQGDLPLLNHTHHSRYIDDIPYWRALADRQGGMTLELGCGGGRVLLALTAAGQTVVGLDCDWQMLLILKATAPSGLRPRLSVFQADMNHFSLACAFPLILMACNTLSALPDDERPVVFHRIAAHLREGGLFAASLPNPEGIRQLPQSGDSELEDEFPHPRTGNPVQVSSAWSRQGERIDILWHYDQLFPDGSVRRSSASASHSLAPVEVYLDELSAAGLEATGLQGDYDGSPYRPDSPYLLIQCTRRQPADTRFRNR